MVFYNNGKGESHIVQNRFTKYLVTALHRKRYSFLRVRSKVAKHKLLTEFSEEIYSLPEKLLEFDLFIVFNEFENAGLQKAIKQLSKRDRYVLLAHVLDEKGFAELAQQLRASYSAIASAYYRAIQRVKKEMGGDLK